MVREISEIPSPHTSQVLKNKVKNTICFELNDIPPKVNTRIKLKSNHKSNIFFFFEVFLKQKFDLIT